MRNKNRKAMWAEKLRSKYPPSKYKIIFSDFPIGNGKASEYRALIGNRKTNKITFKDSGIVSSNMLSKRGLH